MRLTLFLNPSEATLPTLGERRDGKTFKSSTLLMLGALNKAVWRQVLLEYLDLAGQALFRSSADTINRVQKRTSNDTFVQRTNRTFAPWRTTYPDEHEPLTLVDPQELNQTLEPLASKPARLRRELEKVQFRSPRTAPPSMSLK